MAAAETISEMAARYARATTRDGAAARTVSGVAMTAMNLAMAKDAAGRLDEESGESSCKDGRREEASAAEKEASAPVALHSWYSSSGDESPEDADSVSEDDDESLVGAVGQEHAQRRQMMKVKAAYNRAKATVMVQHDSSEAAHNDACRCKRVGDLYQEAKNEANTAAAAAIDVSERFPVDTRNLKAAVVAYRNTRRLAQSYVAAVAESKQSARKMRKATRHTEKAFEKAYSAAVAYNDMLGYP
jgi:hypothetical protein